jgi:cardiolipin synthase (CMP-forming)
MRHIPNLLTSLRIILVPFILLALLSGHYFTALALFALAATTDILDGAAARRFGSITPAGAYLDPIADKCLLSGTFLALAAAHFLPWWLVALIFGRDVFILAGAVIVMRLTPQRRFPPSAWGKASTFIQIWTVGFALGRAVFGGALIDTVASGLIWPCALLTVFSGLHYASQGFRVLRRH